MLKWAVKLGQFDVDYKPRSAIQGQVFADFLLEFPHQLEGDALAVKPTSQASEDLEPTTPTPWWMLYVDGVVNNEEAGAGIVLISHEGHHLCRTIHLDFKVTNNDAEYEALIAGLKLDAELKIKNLNFFSDSMLVVYQVNGGFQARGLRTELY